MDEEDFLSDHGMDSDENSAPSSDEEDPDPGIVMEPEPRNRRDHDDFKFEVLGPEEIVQYMINIIREVNHVVQLPATTTRILLNHFKWDTQKLMEAFYDSDQDRLFREAHIVSPFRRQIQQAASSSSSGYSTRSKFPTITTLPKEESCEICLIVCPSHLMTGLECGHRFCKNCWVEYLTTKIMDDGMGQTIACAAHNCDILVDDQTVMDLISDKRVKVRYQQLITNSFVECNRSLKWCPRPNCTNAIKVTYPDFRPVTCTCGWIFCFKCSHEWHNPICCRLLKRWLKKCEDDSETSNWISANTKECPKCHVTIEKNGGCNHMICRNQSCKVEFCWVCLGPWESHGSSWYNCNRYDDQASKNARDAQERSRAALERYLFYFNRYANHQQSMKFEYKLYAQVKGKMEEMQQHNMSWIEVQFLKKAVDVLCQCRRVLMYTYAFAYYLVSNNMVHIFESNQSDLEKATEVLSEYLERDLTQENVVDIKQKVQDKYRYCEQRCQVLLDHCREGTESDCWHFSE